MRLNKFTGLFMAAVLAVATFNFVPAKNGIGRQSGCPDLFYG